jgi:hypothetical protein
MFLAFSLSSHPCISREEVAEALYKVEVYEGHALILSLLFSPKLNFTLSELPQLQRIAATASSTRLFK